MKEKYHYDLGLLTAKEVNVQLQASRLFNY